MSSFRLILPLFNLPCFLNFKVIVNNENLIKFTSSTTLTQIPETNHTLAYLDCQDCLKFHWNKGGSSWHPIETCLLINWLRILIERKD